MSVLLITPASHATATGASAPAQVCGQEAFWLVLGSWFVLQWVYSAGYAAAGAGSVAYLAHIFGFLTGVIAGLVVRASSPGTARPRSP